MILRSIIMPKVIERPNLIRCEYAQRKGWPSTFRKGARVCARCDRLRCRFHLAPEEPRATHVPHSSAEREEQKECHQRIALSDDSLVKFADNGKSYQHILNSEPSRALQVVGSIEDTRPILRRRGPNIGFLQGGVQGNRRGQLSRC